jgi:hypothetical protein
MSPAPSTSAAATRFCQKRRAGRAALDWRIHRYGRLFATRGRDKLVFTLDENGNRVLKTKPLRTIIGVNNLPWGKWLRLDVLAGTVTVKVGNERVVYRRVGHDVLKVSRR